MDTIRGVCVLVIVLIVAAVTTAIGAALSVLGVILAFLLKCILIGGTVIAMIAFAIWDCFRKKPTKETSTSTTQPQ